MKSRATLLWSYFLVPSSAPMERGFSTMGLMDTAKPTFPWQSVKASIKNPGSMIFSWFHNALNIYQCLSLQQELWRFRKVCVKCNPKKIFLFFRPGQQTQLHLHSPETPNFDTAIETPFDRRRAYSECKSRHRPGDQSPNWRRASRDPGESIPETNEE